MRKLFILFASSLVFGCSTIYKNFQPEEYRGTPYGLYVEIGGDYSGKQRVIYNEIIKSIDKMHKISSNKKILIESLDLGLKAVAFQAAQNLINENYYPCRIHYVLSLMLIEFDQVASAKKKINYIMRVCSDDFFISNRAAGVAYKLDNEGYYNVEREDYINNF